MRKVQSVVQSEKIPTTSRRRAYRLREVEQETGIPVSTLRTMIRRGEINPITGFRTWLIAVEDYERLLATRLRTEGQISK